jgi:hypothetical protein
MAKRPRCTECPKRLTPAAMTGSDRRSRCELVAVDQVDDDVDLDPAECESCWAALPDHPDPGAKRYRPLGSARGPARGLAEGRPYRNRSMTFECSPLWRATRRNEAPSAVLER